MTRRCPGIDGTCQHFDTVVAALQAVACAATSDISPCPQGAAGEPWTAMPIPWPEVVPDRERDHPPPVALADAVSAGNVNLVASQTGNMALARIGNSAMGQGVGAANGAVAIGAITGNENLAETTAL